MIRAQVSRIARSVRSRLSHCGRLGAQDRSTARRIRHASGICDGLYLRSNLDFTGDRDSGDIMEAERELRRDEVPACKMCRAAMHRLCAKWNNPPEPCTWVCAGGY